MTKPHLKILQVKFLNCTTALTALNSTEIRKSSVSDDNFGFFELHWNCTELH